MVKRYRLAIVNLFHLSVGYSDNVLKWSRDAISILIRYTMLLVGGYRPPMALKVWPVHKFPWHTYHDTLVENCWNRHCDLHCIWLPWQKKSKSFAIQILFAILGHST